MYTRYRAARAALVRYLALSEGKTDAEESDRLRRLQGAGRHALKAFRDLLVPALFLASLVQAMEWAELLPLDAPARLIVSNFAAHADADGANPRDDDFAILKIDHATFQGSEYRGRSPLDRCVLRKDVENLLALESLRTLGIDFDLSPVQAGKQQVCAEKLLNSLQTFVEKGPDFKVVLILPVDLHDRDAQTKWISAVHERGLLLADPDFHVQVGMVHQHLDDDHRCPGLGVAMSREAKRSDQMPRQAECVRDEAGRIPLEAEALNIDFLRLAQLKHYSPPGMNLGQQIGQLQNQGITRVILGPGYDRADEFMTPLGDLDGVEIHAAIALEPKMTRRAALDFVIDIGLGIMFGGLFQVFWRQYFTQKLGWHRGAGSPRIAYLWLVGMGVAAAALLGGLVWWSTLAYVHAALWISPTPMALGMLLDALVLGSVHAVVHHEHDTHKSPHDAGPLGFRGLLARAPAFVWWVLVLYVVIKIGRSLFD